MVGLLDMEPSISIIAQVDFTWQPATNAGFCQKPLAMRARACSSLHGRLFFCAFSTSLATTFVFREEIFNDKAVQF
ncbi:MAG TPA: hypothetical protein VFT99_10260, partial [Roseiflexaceae bacterium]|nr:hypothetical protein [Roseiflexaceae bacterium]